MDFFMKSTTAAFLFKEPHHLTAQSTILRIYELFVRTIYHGFEDTPSMLLSVPDDNTKTSDASDAILNHIDEFTRATKQHGANLIRDTPRHFTQELSVGAVYVES
jgi:hypothetical protein